MTATKNTETQMQNRYKLAEIVPFVLRIFGCDIVGRIPNFSTLKTYRHIEAFSHSSMASNNVLLKSAIAGLLVSSVSGSSPMDCGSGVGLCGVLTLESGYGSGNYQVCGIIYHQHHHISLLFFVFSDPF
jgi:hypothetical protein